MYVFKLSIIDKNSGYSLLSCKCISCLSKCLLQPCKNAINFSHEFRQPLLTTEIFPCGDRIIAVV